ncbi:rhodanese-like domain-containing protein [Falsiroseomonas tokyonensis]|uniref:Rhodanese-like domain-containing protein n=1 Tax=Falsiroseomonas tokyonensis TaxID=430521 RepID=A0ABV7BWW7_9PROT|nr:rhodanese-like domain-containing protein [Falsiroseomonas tokyonensis]MBU8538472.1 rhodanese-like domain-containing protein [Falsiroseomonas tokyonensis]
MPTTVKEMLAAANAAVPRISAAEAQALAAQPQTVLLDVRDAAEVQASGKAKGALAVSRGLLEFRADPESPLHDAAFDRAKTIIVYCASGGRSALAGKTLKDMGYGDVRNLGGFKDWVEGGGEVENA